MKYLFLILLLSLCACKFDNYSSATKETGKDTKYIYGQELWIQHGFYRGYTCLVLQEYDYSVFCRLARVSNGDGTYGDIKSEYQININVGKDNVQEEQIITSEPSK